MIDLLVVGAGPAGLATAMFAARAGLDTVVIDSRPAPIDKACGEGLMPGAVAALQDLGIPLTGRAFHGIRYLDGTRSATAFFRSGSGMGVRRTTLHSEMTGRARQLGVRFETATVTDIEQDQEGVTAAGLRARYLAAADGLHSPVRRTLALNSSSHAAPRWGLRRHFRVQPWTSLVEVHWAARAEAYVTPVGPDEVGVAVISSARRPLAEHLQDFPRLAERLVDAAPTGSVRGAGPLRQRTVRRVAGRVLFVGDAAGYVDALTGEGIAVSLACAASLVDSIRRDRPESYERAWLRDSRRYRWMTETLLATRRIAEPSIVPAAAWLPDLFGMAVRRLAG